MIMRRFVSMRRISMAVSTASLLILGGCATSVPAFDVPYKRVSLDENIPPIPDISSITRRIQCELIDVAKGPEQDKIKIAEQDIQVVVELSLSVTQDGKLAPSFSFIQGPLTFASGFSSEQSREQNFTTYLTFSLAEMSLANKPTECKDPPDTNLAGTLGLTQIFDLSASAGPFKKWDKDGATGVFGGSITFTIDSQLTATGPTWRLTTFQGPGSLLSASNKNVDRLTFGFVRGPKAGRAKAQIAAFSVIDSVRQNQITNALQLLANAR